ncbi:hypothetical protein AB0D45_26270 [Streptomyces sp. NPDC048352]|uniref:hypothetical protein n=1 Tax=Streptomyces sp. NPDC048352 TaxID=3154718 RepID=UPI00342FB5A8
MAGGRSAAGLAAWWLACVVALDVLQRDGVELLTRRIRSGARLLEEVFSTRALAAPWSLCPMTVDLAAGRGWLECWTEQLKRSSAR